MTIQSYRANIKTSKRAAILSAGMDLFMRHGFAGTGMAEIAKHADVSTATLYKHFESKEELFSEIAVQHIEPFHAAAEGLLPDLNLSDDPVEALVGLSAPFVELLGNPQTLALFRLIIAEGDRFPELKEVIYRHGRDPFKDRLTKVLISLQDQDVLTIEEPSAAAEFYIGMLSYWLLFAPIFNAEMRFSAQQIEHIIRESALMFLARFDANASPIVRQSDQGESLRLGTSTKLTPTLERALDAQISA